MGQWCVFTPMAAVDSVVHAGAWHYLKSDCTVMRETAGAWLDDGVPVSMKVVTAWFQLSGMQGYQCIWKALILGQRKSAHSLRVQAGFDYSPSFVQDVLFTPPTPDTWGSGATYGGAGTIYGGSADDNLYQWQFFPDQFRCQAMRLSIEDVIDSTAVGTGEGMSLSSLALEVGLMPGVGRVPNARSKG